MKKFLFVLIVLLLVSVALPVISSADGFDFSSMSLEELLGLRNAVDEEIRTRVSQPSAALYNGKYIVGKDIRSGRFVLTVIQPVIDEWDDEAHVCIEFVDGEHDTLYLHAGESTILDLIDGTTIEINDVISATLTEVPQASYAP
jgi:hypothetical protein